MDKGIGGRGVWVVQKTRYSATESIKMGVFEDFTRYKRCYKPIQEVLRGGVPEGVPVA